MRKILSSFVFIFAFATYAIFRTHVSTTPLNTQTAVSTAPSSVVITNTPTTVSDPSTNERHATLTPTVKKPGATIVKIKTPMHTTTMHTTMHRGPYVDGMYTGPLTDAYYERISVRVVIRNGKLVKVSFLPFQIYNGTSQAITSYAMPRLRLEALSVQNARVNNISGATEISNAFKNSLSKALLKAA